MADKEKETTSEKGNRENVANEDENTKSTTPKTRHKRSIMDAPYRSNLDCNQETVDEFI